MGLVLSAFRNPAAKFFLFRRGQRQVRLGRRHEVLRIGRENFRADEAGFRFAGHDSVFAGFFPLSISFLGEVETQPGFPTPLIRSVTLETPVRENWPDVAVELKLFRRWKWRSTQRHQSDDEQRGTAERLNLKRHLCFTPEYEIFSLWLFLMDFDPASQRAMMDRLSQFCFLSFG